MLTLFVTFLKLGAVSFGTGYVLFAFLHAEFVDGLRWLSEQQHVDAVAISHVTPGPVFTTAALGEASLVVLLRFPLASPALIGVGVAVGLGLKGAPGRAGLGSRGSACDAAQPC